MDNLFEQLTAKEARALAEKNNKTLEDLRRHISQAAREGQTGLDRWLNLSSEKRDREIVKKCADTLIADGFEVTYKYSSACSDFTITIKW